MSQIWSSYWKKYIFTAENLHKCFFTFLYDLKQLVEEFFLKVSFQVVWILSKLLITLQISTVPHFILFYLLPVSYATMCIIMCIRI